MNKPQPQVLFLWRITLILIVFAAAFIASVLFAVGSRVWVVAIGMIAAFFLLGSLYYLPMLYRGMAFTVKDEAVFIWSGVFIKREIAVPLLAVQYATVSQSIFARLFGLSSIVISAAGGRAVIHGLKKSDAEALASVLTNRE